MITGVGHALPTKVVTNADLASHLETDDEWIVERTGIRERRWISPGESTITLAVEAGGKALAEAGVDPGDVRLLILATCTPTRKLPGDAAQVHLQLGLQGGAFDLNAACSGFVYALATASSMADTLGGPVLVVAAETLTDLVDPTDRSTAVLFGDGAGAAVVEPGGGLLGLDFGADGEGDCHLEVPVDESWMRMDGPEVFRFAVRTLERSCRAALADAGLGPADVDLFVPHQANARIIDKAASRLGITPAKTVLCVERHGNTSAASIPLALSEAVGQDRVHDGQILLVSGFGAGLSWASAVLRWGEDDR
jgi:3-oxoacyl-[acyl-carrier-protein] synthase-3